MAAWSSKGVVWTLGCVMAMVGCSAEGDDGDPGGGAATGGAGTGGFATGGAGTGGFATGGAGTGGFATGGGATGGAPTGGAGTGGFATGGVATGGAPTGGAGTGGFATGGSAAVGDPVLDLSVSSIATWRYGASAAYTLIHDDAAEIASVTEIVLPALDARGLVGAFGPTVNGVSSSPTRAAALTAAVADGHEILNHSATHIPTGNTELCPGVTVVACGGGLGGPGETTTAQTELETLLGVEITFYIYPYDYRAPDVAALVASSHLGDRSGWGGDGTKSGVNSPTFSDFDVAFETAGDNALTLAKLDDFVEEEVVPAGGWGVRELHGVGDSSWGQLATADYTAHLDTLVELVEAGDLWVAGPTDVIRYKHVRHSLDCGSPSVGASTISFSNSSSAACLTYSTDVTLIVTTAATSLSAWQGSRELDVFPGAPGTFLVTMNPADGAADVRQP